MNVTHARFALASPSDSDGERAAADAVKRERAPESAAPGTRVGARLPRCTGGLRVIGSSRGTRARVRGRRGPCVTERRTVCKAQRVDVIAGAHAQAGSLEVPLGGRGMVAQPRAWAAAREGEALRRRATGAGKRGRRRRPTRGMHASWHCTVGARSSSLRGGSSWVHAPPRRARVSREGLGRSVRIAPAAPL